MYSSNQTVSVDTKGRASLPSRMREQLMGNTGQDNVEVIAVKAINKKCIWLYDPIQWHKVIEHLYKTENKTTEFREQLDDFVANAHPLEPDSAGRILLPQSLRDYARLKKKAVFAGAFDKFVIWSEDAWHNRQDNYSQQDKDNFLKQFP